MVRAASEQADPGPPAGWDVAPEQSSDLAANSFLKNQLPDHFSNKLQALREAGAEQFDPVGLDHAERLMQRAMDLTGGAATRLASRANKYLAGYEIRFNEAHVRARAHARRLEQFSLLPSGKPAHLLNSGNFPRLQQLARRNPERSLRLRQELQQGWHEALDAEAEKRGLTSPGMIDAPSLDACAEDDPDTPDVSETIEIALALYRDAASATHAALSIAKAVDALPVEAGRYHATTVATRALQAMQNAPQYLHAQLQRLEVLALLEQFGASALAEHNTKGKKKKSPGKKRAPRRVKKDAPA